MGTAVAGRTSQAQGKLCLGGLLIGVGEAGLPGAQGLRVELGGQCHFGDVDTSVAGRGRKPRKQKASPPLSSTLSCSGTLELHRVTADPLPRLAFPMAFSTPGNVPALCPLCSFVPGPREVTPGHLGPERCTHGSLCDQPGSSEPLAQSESCSPRGGSQRSEVIISSPGW